MCIRDSTEPAEVLPELCLREDEQRGSEPFGEVEGAHPLDVQDTVTDGETVEVAHRCGPVRAGTGRSGHGILLTNHRTDSPGAIARAWNHPLCGCMHEVPPMSTTAAGAMSGRILNILRLQHNRGMIMAWHEYESAPRSTEASSKPRESSIRRPTTRRCLTELSPRCSPGITQPRSTLPTQRMTFTLSTNPTDGAIWRRSARRRHRREEHAIQRRGLVVRIAGNLPSSGRHPLA